MTENFTYLNATDYTDLPSEMPAADSQMTTGFFLLRPAKGWETNHSQMTTSFFMLQSWMVDAGRWILCAGFLMFEFCLPSREFCVLPLMLNSTTLLPTYQGP